MRTLLTLLITLLATCATLAQENPNLKYYYPVPRANPPQNLQLDLAVYGGTPGGVTAAVQAARMGKKSAIFSFNKFVGGLTSGGLSATDVGKPASIGGIAKEFYGRAGKIVGFKPSEAEEMFLAMLKEANVPVYYDHRLESLDKQGARITKITFENGNTVEAKMFVDATYEGDLFAAAGVTYHIGRESNATYSETINGVEFKPGHNFNYPVDPYAKEGDAASGLLWGISNDPNPGKAGEGDRKIQAYNFRMFLSNKADKIPFPKPANYDASKYQLLLRYLLKKPDLKWSFSYKDGPFQLQNGDCNNAGGFSTDLIGGNYRWPDGHYEPGASADPSKPSTAPKISFKELYELREKLFQDHVTYQQGLMYFMANDPAVPQELRDRVNQFGLTGDQFATTGHWPHQLYIREGRRMISDYVMTEANCRGKTLAEDPIGLASYGMDSHHCQRLVVQANGKKVVKNEGNVEVPVAGPYPVAYRSIVPKQAECENLLVPVCLSSTHMSYGSIRMEPVFMMLGQSAGTAAVMAIDTNIPVQKVEYPKLKERLLADKQVLEWTKEMGKK